ncbi:MAG: LysM peptidoglycan-binding domain-containing protein [Clostridia bacterium]|nr:LysM peptidoglycan-binding domain-containing protein [Clostridia bacterium]
MKILKYGSRGAEVQLLQLALNRAGFGPLATDGIFGSGTLSALRAFQSEIGIKPDGIAGRFTHSALYPWYTGHVSRTIRAGDTLYKLAERYGVSLRAVLTANPGLDPLELPVGGKAVVPLPFPVVPVDIDWSAALVGYAVRGITARYPFVSDSEYGRSAMGKPLRYLGMGSGSNTVFYNAEHHANEWITTPVLMKFTEDLARAYAFGETVYGREAAEIFASSRIYIAPAVNPDGMDLVTGALTYGDYYDRAAGISAGYTEIPFPSGWKANIAGTDLNLQYPAGWEEAKKIKFAEGYTGPAPRDYVGTAPLSAAESRAIYKLTQRLDPALTLSYHTQGKTIYWKYLDYEPPRSREIAECFARASGYAVSETPYASGFAGYKDWFIENYDRPGYTIECGVGENPLPLSQFQKIYEDNVGILTLAALGC